MDNEISRVMDCCINSYQKTRSIIMESNGYGGDDRWQLEFIDPFLFSEDTEKLVWKWATKKPIEKMDAYNAISWIRMKSIPWWFELQNFLEEAGLSEYIDNQMLLLNRRN